VRQFSVVLGLFDVGAGSAWSTEWPQVEFQCCGTPQSAFGCDRSVYMQFMGFADGILPHPGFERMCDGNPGAMTNDTQQAPLENAEKDTSDWVTGDEPMTGPQRSYLNTLAQEAGRDIPDDLTKAQASELIDELQQQTGRSS